MKGIGGNTQAIIQVRTTTDSVIGSQAETWTDAVTLKGWIDLASGDSRYTAFSAKVQQSTHIFIGDYVPIPQTVTAENARAIIDGKRYDIMLLDNPMGMGSGSQWEIYLKYTGGQ